ncbi:unnamed protein product [Rhizophagus irregularis]|nr:unnamed protein product [Rhizophagus irregularis]CAB5216287.1 unnamed protein product [Rhizophagus irregularis]
MVYASIRTCYDVELKDWVKSLTGDAPSLHYIKMAIPCAMNPNNVRFADYNVDLRIFVYLYHSHSHKLCNRLFPTREFPRDEMISNL